jgi:hypothetical protein
VLRQEADPPQIVHASPAAQAVEVTEYAQRPSSQLGASKARTAPSRHVDVAAQSELFWQELLPSMHAEPGVAPLLQSGPAGTASSGVLEQANAQSESTSEKKVERRITAEPYRAWASAACPLPPVTAGREPW